MMATMTTRLQALMPLQQRRLLVGATAASSSLVGWWFVMNLTDASTTNNKNSRCRWFNTTTTACNQAASIGLEKQSIVLPTRSQQLQRLSQHSNKDQPYDVLVIGGGATGCGVALDASMRGLSTALIEKNDFGNETSARSTKLLWAGIRYIATALSSLLRFRNVTRPVQAVKECVSEFQMVLGAHRERKLLLENNPHLTNWVPIAIPMTSWIAWPPPMGHPLFASAPLTMPLFMKFYDSLSGFSCPPSHIMGIKRSLRKFPQLDDTDAKYYQIFYEGQHNDARTNTCIALTAAEEGATIANYAEMIQVLTDPETGKAIGVKCRDNLSQQTFDVYSKAIVFCGGPFTDQMRQIEDATAKPAVAAAAGTHIVLPGYYSPGGIGMLDMNTSDGRFLFFLPWQGHTLVGTTDRKDKVVSDPGPPEEEIEWLLTEVQKYLSDDLKVRRSDVLSAWQGFRPLASDPNAPPGSPVSRDHVISTHPTTNITFITGGKWTTYREMAQDVVNKIVDRHQFTQAGPCQTATRPLRGGVGYNRNVAVSLVQDYGVTEDTAKHLARTYGMHAFDVCQLALPTHKRWPRFGSLLVEGFPYLECEIAYACRNEMACTVSDMLSLRTRLAYLNKDAALAVAPKVADLMAKELQWSRRERNQQLQDAEAFLQKFGGPFPDPAAVRKKFESVKDVRELFAAFDNDGTGFIDYAEFRDIIGVLGLAFSEKEASTSFQKIDLSRDGKITCDEFIQWWEQSGSDKLKKRLDEKFKLSSDKLGEGAQSRGAAFG